MCGDVLRGGGGKEKKGGGRHTRRIVFLEAYSDQVRTLPLHSLQSALAYLPFTPEPFLRPLFAGSLLTPL